MKNNEISQAVIKRLPRYHRYLDDLLANGVERISSSDLSKRMQVTASQIRQDLNNFGGFGQQGYGYNVKYLYEEISKILGLCNEHRIVIVGAGNLGQALASSQIFDQEEFNLKAIFDVNPKLKGKTVNGAPVLMMEDFPAFVSENNIEIAVLTVPKDQANSVAKLAIENGVTGLWNFAHIDLSEIPDDVIVENVHLSDSLLQLSYRVSVAKSES